MKTVISIILGIIGYLLWIGIIYGAITTFEWKINPAYWEDGSRFVFSFLGIFVGIFIPSIVIGIRHSKSRQNE